MVAREALPPQYEVSGGVRHSLTNLVSQARSGDAVVFSVATDEPGRGATVTVSPSANGFSVAVAFSPSIGVKRVFETFAVSAGEHFLGGGMRGDSVDLRSLVVAGKVLYQCGSSVVTPFYASTAGYGVTVDTAAISRIAFPGAAPDAGVCARDQTAPCDVQPRQSTVQSCAKSDGLSYRLFTGGLPAIVHEYVSSAGLPALPPPSQFALMKWRDIVQRPKELLEDVVALRSRQIPIGWVIVDDPWEAAGCKGTLQFGDSRYPTDARPWVDALHAQHVRVMIWVSPLVTRSPSCPQPIYSPDELLGSGQEAEIDFTNPAAVAIFEQKLRALMSLGFDGVKADRGDELDLESLKVYAGTGGAVENAYPLLYDKAVTTVLQELRGNDYATFMRAGFTGSESFVHGISAGDLEGSFAGLRTAIREAQSAGVSGFPYWGSDIGGYSNVVLPLTAETFVRWAQFAAVTPVFEVGGEGKSAQFWVFGPRTVALFRAAAVLHYELFPYLYDLAHVASATGLPIIRPLGLAQPDDPRAWRHDLEFLVGPDLLAAPITNGVRTGNDLSGPPTEASVYLPSGTWVDLSRGTRSRGHTTLVRSTPISDSPLYLRAGSAIPFDLRTPQIWPTPWPVDALQPANRAGWLYAPAPGPAVRVHSASGTLRAAERGSVVTVELADAAPQSQVLVLGPTRPCRVSIGGTVVAEAGSSADLRRHATGWLFTRGDFGGVVLKLEGSAGQATATIARCG